MYIVQGYDKDNDMYIELFKTEKLETACLIAEVFEPLVIKDCLVNRECGEAEPIDWIEIINTITQKKVAIYG